MSASRTLRLRQEDIQAAADRMTQAGDEGGLAVLARTISLHRYPIAAAAFYACEPLWVDGLEVEGATATFVSDGSRTIYAYNVGSQIPPAGTKLIVHSCGGRWAFRYDG